MPKNAAGLLVPGELGAIREVRRDIPRPEYVGREAPRPYTGSNVYTAEEIDAIRWAGNIASRALDEIGNMIRPGITTDDIDALAHDVVTSYGAYPSTLGYRGFPKSCCTSVNEVICHGIPDNTVLEEGDIVNVDITAYINGFHGDTNRMFEVGEVSSIAHDLIEHTREALALFVTMDQPAQAMHTVRSARQACPDLPIYVRSRDEAHAHELRLAGANGVVPETLEAGLQLAAFALARAGLNDSDVATTIEAERAART